METTEHVSVESCCEDPDTLRLTKNAQAALVRGCIRIEIHLYARYLLLGSNMEVLYSHLSLVMCWSDWLFLFISIALR